MTVAQIDGLIKKAKALIKQARGRYRVTCKLLMARTRTKASLHTIMRAFHKRGFYFRKHREKPSLTTEDVKARFAFGSKYRAKGAGWWPTAVQLHIDCKWFKVYLNGKARLHAAKEKVWGAFQTVMLCRHVGSRRRVEKTCLCRQRPHPHRQRLYL